MRNEKLHKQIHEKYDFTPTIEQVGWAKYNVPTKIFNWWVR